MAEKRGIGGKEADVEQKGEERGKRGRNELERGRKSIGERKESGE